MADEKEVQNERKEEKEIVREKPAPKLSLAKAPPSPFKIDWAVIGAEIEAELVNREYTTTAKYTRNPRLLHGLVMRIIIKKIVSQLE